MVSSTHLWPRQDIYYGQLCVCWCGGGAFWWEDRPVISNCCWPLPLWSFSVRVPRDSWPYFTVSDSRLLQPGGPGPHIYIPQEQGGSVVPAGTGFFFCRLLWLAGLWYWLICLKALICLGRNHTENIATWLLCVVWVSQYLATAHGFNNCCTKLETKIYAHSLFCWLAARTLF
jgi:hypothetical protein